MAELYGDLFGRSARPLEGFVFVAVDERGEDVVSDEICRRNNGKQERRRGGRSVQLPDWVVSEIKRHHIAALLTWVTKMKSFSWGESLSVVQKVSLLFLLGSFVFVGPISTREGGREVGREVLREEARVAASCQKIK